MAQPFKIVPGIYVVPNHGRVDCTKKVKQATAVQLYLNKKFSQFIELQEDGVKLLKKEKLDNKTIAGLITRSTSADEVNLLVQLSDTEAIQNIGKQKLKSLE